MKSNQILKDIDDIKHDMLKMMDKIDSLEQVIINLKWLLKMEKAKMPSIKKQKS